MVSILSDLHPSSLEENVLQLNSTLAANLDTFALLSKKAACWKMERKWRLTGQSVYYQEWKDLLGGYRALMETERSSYFSQAIVNNQNNPRHLFQTINRLLQVNPVTTMPVSQQLCDSFLQFFNSKIVSARKEIYVNPDCATSLLCTSGFTCVSFTHFSLLDCEALTREVSNMKSTTCLLDPIPTNLFKSCFPVWCPIILSILNESLETGVVPAVLKTAAVTPVLKKDICSCG